MEQVYSYNLRVHMGLPNEETLCLINEKLETKASSHAGQCIPAGSSVSPPRRVLIYYVNNYHG